jgi:hypothetical protein
MSSDLESRTELLAIRVNGLRRAVRIDNFKQAQRLRMGFVPYYLKDLEGPLHNDLVQLFEVSGVWLRDVRDRHETKRQIQQLIRRVMPRLQRGISATRTKKLDIGS